MRNTNKNNPDNNDTNSPKNISADEMLVPWNPDRIRNAEHNASRALVIAAFESLKGTPWPVPADALLQFAQIFDIGLRLARRSAGMPANGTPNLMPPTAPPNAQN